MFVDFNIQVILSPIDSVADTYRALLPEGTPSEFQRILELKVVSKLISCYFIFLLPPDLASKYFICSYKYPEIRSMLLIYPVDFP